jgi:hypothetical protein
LSFIPGTLFAPDFFKKEKVMANVYNNQDSSKTTADLGSYNAADEAPRNISRTTWFVIGAAAIFLIVFAILATLFLNYPTGGSASQEKTGTTQSR